MKTDKRLSDFQNGTSAASDATLDTEQLISHTIASLVGTVDSLHGSNGGVISVSEVHELLRFMKFWTVLCLSSWQCCLYFGISFLFCCQAVL